MSLPPYDDTLEQLRRELRRVVDRLGHLSVQRLGQPAPPWSTRAAAARDTAQRLADLAQGVEERAAATPPVRRLVPHLGDQAAADQLAVPAYDLLAAVPDVPPGALVWLDGRRCPVAEVAATGKTLLVALRRAV